jgi:hypothetical protein
MTVRQGDTMMHEHGMPMQEGMQPQDLLMEKIWEDLTDDQKTKLIARMIDAKIQMKENMIEHLKYKIGTFRMVKDFLCE